MLITTRGRYALRLLIDLAENNQGDTYIPLKDIVARQETAQKYAERLMAVLARNDLVKVQIGKGGGYRLNRDPADCTVGEVLRIMDEELAPVVCLKCKPDGCHRAEGCRTLPMWQKLDRMITDFLDGTTLADLMDNEQQSVRAKSKVSGRGKSKISGRRAS